MYLLLVLLVICILVYLSQAPCSPEQMRGETNMLRCSHTARQVQWALCSETHLRAEILHLDPTRDDRAHMSSPETLPVRPPEIQLKTCRTSQIFTVSGV